MMCSPDTAYFVITGKNKHQKRTRLLKPEWHSGRFRRWLPYVARSISDENSIIYTFHEFNAFLDHIDFLLVLNYYVITDPDLDFCCLFVKTHRAINRKTINEFP